MHGTLPGKARTETITLLEAAIEAKDEYTAAHVRRVARFALAIAGELGLRRAELRELRAAALLHDVGKVWIADHVLHKRAPLEPHEWEEMRRHPELGFRAFRAMGEHAAVAEGMLYHHERVDGRGYPCGLRGDEIPLYARIIAVADTFDAMTSDRPYRGALPEEHAYAEIVRCAGTQFCEKVVDAFVRAFRMERMGKSRKEKAFLAEATP